MKLTFSWIGFKEVNSLGYHCSRKNAREFGVGGTLLQVYTTNMERSRHNCFVLSEFFLGGKALVNNRTQRLWNLFHCRNLLSSCEEYGFVSKQTTTICVGLRLVKCLRSYGGEFIYISFDFNLAYCWNTQRGC